MPSPPRTAVCADCQRERTAIFKRSMCPPCYERFKQRKRGVRPRAEWEALRAEKRRTTDPFMVVFGQTTPGPDGCVIFTGRIKSDGYGSAPTGTGRGTRAHRLAYMTVVGPIPQGLTIDHLCHNRDVECRGGNGCLHRRCVNPHHLEAVTSAENTRRAAIRPNSAVGKRGWTRQIDTGFCPRGHELTPENTAWEKRRPGSDERRPRCRTCLRGYQAAFRERRRNAA